MIDNRESISDYYPTMPPQTPEPEVDKGVLEAHLNARNNPHQVTAEQVGTYDKAHIDQELQRRNPEAIKASIATIVAEAKGELNAVVKEGKEVAQQASASATSASQSASNASNSESLANQHAKDAKDWRDEAENFRHEAINARDDARVEANKVSASVTNAQTFAKQAQSARGEAMTYASNAQTSASEASQAVTDGKREIAIQGETIVANATEQADRAETSAESASKSAQQAEDAKNAIGDVGGRLEAVETLDGVFEKRDVMGELQKAKGWSQTYADNVAIRNVATTAKGNIVVYWQYINTNNRLCVLGKDGALLVEVKTAQSMSYQVCEWLVQSGDVLYFLTDTACYKITDTETSATIESIGNLDFNGLATKLPIQTLVYQPTRTMTIGDKVIINTLVIDLTSLKVVQVLSSGIVAPYTENGESYSTLVNGNVAQLTVSEDGLIEQADFVNSSGEKIYKNACVISNENDTTASFLLPSNTAMAEVFLGYKYIFNKFGTTSILPILPNTTLGRDKHTLAIATDGNIVKLHSKQKADHYADGVALGIVKVPLRKFPLIVGVDDGGIWAIEDYTSIWAGYHPTRALVRVKF